jgi:dolichyl-diphosphooligosaccharide--protein glycosyltransferase/undecaprenyl-diphosphooligosaccharide--protein glycosyltransferase
MNPFNIKNEEEYNSLKYSLIFMAVAYVFSIAIRMIWVYQFQGNESFYWNNELMINTNDGYYFASAVQNLLFGMHSENPQIPSAINSYPGVIYTSVLLAKILPFSYETVILYMPAVISSLVVVPMILIARLFKMQIYGFLSAVVGSIAWSYYNRTMIGYYDSDMFSVLFQMLVLYSFISLLVEHKLSNIILSFIFISTYPFFYPQGLSLIYAMYAIYLVYALIEYRNDSITYASIAVIAIALSPVSILLKIVFLLFVLYALGLKKIEQKHWMGFALVAFVFFMVNANVFSLISAKLFGYINRSTESSGLHFFQVIQTVREAGKIPFEVMANRIIGSSVGVIVALAGYILLLVRHRQFIVALPLIAIGVFSLWGGLRFTVYAVPIAAFGALFFIYVLTSYVKDAMPRYIVILVAVSALIYPNVTHVVSYKVPTVFTKDEVTVLDKLKSMGSDKDYIVAWWDYGYPLWFYTNKNTLIDGGKHHHDNYIVSRVLTTSSQKEAALLSRLAVETYVDSGYKNVADTLFRNHQQDQLNVENFFDELNSDMISVPKPSRDVYVYFPLRMLDILPTVKVFSNIDLDTGKSLNSPFFFAATQVIQKEDKVDFGRGLVLNQTEGIINIGDQKLSVKEVVTVGYKPDGKLGVHRLQQHKDGSLIILTLQSYNKILIMDTQMFNSTYIQMFFLENYDKEYFEPVIISPWSKVYRVKS